MAAILGVDTDPWESVLSVSRRKGVSRHLVMAAAALGILRAKRIAGRLVVWRQDVERWDPSDKSDSAAA